VAYAGSSWRSDFSSAGPPIYTGSEDFTLDSTGAPGMHETGAMHREQYGYGLVSPAAK
jgi:hypothetical protein